MDVIYHKLEDGDGGEYNDARQRSRLIKIW